ncbi:MAG: ribonuclease R [Sphingomonadales bacterium]|jgi:ribonuclease R
MAKKGKDKASSGLPTRAEILDYISQTGGKITRRDLARAFHIKGDDRARLRSLLNDMAYDGDLERASAKIISQGNSLPRVGVVTINHISESGRAYGKAENWKGEGDGPRIRIIEEKQKRGRKSPKALGIGDRFLARLEGSGDKYRARIIKRFEKRDEEGFLGVFRFEDGDGPAGWIEPVDKKARSIFMVSAADHKDAKDGELVRAMPLPHHKRQFGPPQARVTEALGDILSPQSISLIAVHQHGIPIDFPTDALKQARDAKAAPLGTREDLRNVPLITIDPHDARDHDDAVFAEPDSSPKNPEGWHVIVAIADVSYYVTPGSPLDKAARERGNSCYFPDRVVPMLPEELSTDLCSLKAEQDRASLVAHLYFSKTGRLISHKFTRALIRCAANLSYEDVQSAIDGKIGEAAEPFVEGVLKPLYAAYDAIKYARNKRQPLELDLPERKVILDKEGMVADVKLRERLDAHRLIEDFMIAANVAAAEALEHQRSPLLYRVHEEPSEAKVEALRDYLDSLDIRLAKGQVMRPALFNRVLERARGTSFAEGISEMVLRSQMQAYYHPENLGHFGLALGRYAHFTSPIRRYADLLVHRALIRAYKLGDDGLADWEVAQLSSTAEHISATERRAMMAERDSLDRYLAAYYAHNRGKQFEGRITGVTRFGLFIKVEPAGGDGFVPAAQMGADYFHHDETRQALIGEVTGDAYQLGDRVEVKIRDAEAISGSLRLELVSDAPRKLSFSAKSRGRKKGKDRRRRR